VVTEPKTPRAASAKDIYDIAVKFNQSVSIIECVEEAVDAVLAEAKDDDTICITGSLYTVGEAKRFLSKREN